MQKSLAIFLLLYSDLGLYSITWSWLTSIVVACFIGLFFTARSAGILAAPHPLGTLARFSYPLYISNSLSFVAGWVDQIFVLPFLGAVYLGMYHLAVRAVAVPSLIATSIVTALFPKLSELYTRHGRTALKKAFGNSTRYAVLAGFPIVVGIASLSYPILVIFAGPNYAEAALPLTVLCFSVLPTILGVAIGPTLMTLERTKIVSMMIIVAIFSSTTVSYVTLAYLNLGMLGTALARVLSSFAAFGYGIYALRGVIRTMFDTESLWKTSLACFFMAIAIVSMSYFLKEIVSQTVLLLVSVLLGAAVYFCGVVALRTFKKQDIELLNESLPDKLKRVSVWLDRLVLAD
jgi:O-antigen/teichoic acid export membrane protein